MGCNRDRALDPAITLIALRLTERANMLQYSSSNMAADTSQVCTCTHAYSDFWHYMHVCGQLHAQAAFIPRGESTQDVPIMH
jgi:hypothetical protein